MTSAAASIPLVTAPGWDRWPGLLHGFCGRRGGVSRGDFAELNVSTRVGDHDAAVRENWRRIAQLTGGVPVTTMRQVHGASVAVVEAACVANGEADALITAHDGLALAVLTADCVPLLLICPSRRLAAAVHAGWRGTAAGVVRMTLTQLHRRYGVTPVEVHAALGPAIGGCCYEVGNDVVDAVLQRCPANDAVLPGRGAKPRLDLRLANRHQLVHAGVPPAQITLVGPCTCCQTDVYFSHRANVHTGRQLSFVGWRDLLGRPPALC